MVMDKEGNQVLQLKKFERDLKIVNLKTDDQGIEFLGKDKIPKKMI